MVGRLCFIVNPAAGAGQAIRRWERLRERVRELRSALHVEYTEAPGHAITLAREAAVEFDAVVAVGGDGTVSEVATGLLTAPSNATLAILPVGTANDAARQFGIRSVEDAIAGLANGIRRVFDTIEVAHSAPQGTQVRHALMFVAAGFGAELLARTTAGIKRVFGPKLCYLVGFLRALWCYRQSRIEAKSECGEFKGSLFHVCAGNTEYAGGHSMRLSPGAQPDDGTLNLCIIERVSRLEAFLHLPRLVRGTHPSHPKVRYFSGTRLDIDADPQAPLAIDGDLVGLTPASFRVRPAVLPVLVPGFRGG